MLKFFYTLLTDPLGLPLEWFWEYIILTILGWVVHEIAWAASPGGRFGSLIYWSTKLLTFFGLWAVLYAVIVAGKYLIAHWVWFAVAAVVIVAVRTGWHKLMEL